MKVDAVRLLRIAKTIKAAGMDALSQEDWDYWIVAVGAAGELIAAEPPERIAGAVYAWRLLKALPADVSARFADWELHEFATLWPVIRDELGREGVDVRRVDSAAA